MNACSDYCREYYGDLRKMQASITARAAFENKPLDSLYSYRLYEDLGKTIAGPKTTGNATRIREAIDEKISASLRSVDGCLAQGNCRRMAGGELELEMRNIDGLNYSVRAWNDEAQTRRLHVSIPIEHHGSYYSSSASNLSRLTKRQIQSLRYRFTTDGWQSCREVKACLRRDDQLGLIIDFDDLRTFPLIGRLQGRFRLLGVPRARFKDPSPQLGAYVFAIPDRHELMSVVARC
jgi:hypothetical protein